MHHQSPVPPHLQQPLFIDTDINYSLDMSKFPGLDDPQYMYEPALLIAKQPESTIDQCRERLQCPNVNHPRGNNSPEPSKDLLEELLNIIDSCSSELLDRISGPQPQQTGQGMCKSIKDVYSSVPHKQAVPRNLHISNQKLQTPFASVRNNSSVCAKYTTRDYHKEMSFYGHHHGNNTNIPPMEHISNQNIGFYPVSNYQCTGIRNNICNKRKRSADLAEFPVYKRHCSGMGTSNCLRTSNYTQNFPLFKEMSSNRSYGLIY